MKWAAGMLFVAVLVVSLLLYIRTQSNAAFGPTLARCMQESDRQGCLRHALPVLLKHSSTEAILNYIVATTSEQSVVSNCHLIAHAAGEATYLKDESLERALSQCTSACSYGCFHGAVASAIATTFGESYLNEDIAHADTAQLEAEGSKYCADQALCHGMGHVARIATSSLEAALAICDTIASGENASACYGGVFMEDSGNVTFIKRERSHSSNGYGYPCDTVSLAHSRSCYMQLYDYQYPRFRAENVLIADQEKIQIRVCSELTGKRRADCFYGIGYKQDRSIGADGASMHHGPAVCASLARADYTACMLGLSRNYAAFSRADDAISYCESQSPDNTSACFQNIFQFITVRRDTIPTLCTTYGSKACTDEYATFLKLNSRGAHAPVGDE